MIETEKKSATKVAALQNQKPKFLNQKSLIQNINLENCLGQNVLFIYRANIQQQRPHIKLKEMNKS